MAKGLVTRADIEYFATYEVVAVSVAVLVPGVWALPAFMAGYLLIMRTRLRPAGIQRERAPSAPWSVSLLAAIVVIGTTTVVFREFGGNGYGWLIVALGVWMSIQRVLDRRWSPPSAHTEAPA